jgi:hypothetical protein
MNKNTMVIFSSNPFKRYRICIRNQYSDWFNDFDLLRIGKAFYFNERTEYKFGIFGIQFVLIHFVKTQK